MQQISTPYLLIHYWVLLIHFNYHRVCASPWHKIKCDLNAFFLCFTLIAREWQLMIVILLITLTSLPSMSLHFVPSTAVCMAFIIVAVNRDITTAPTRTQIIPNTRPGKDFGVTSPYLIRSRRWAVLRQWKITSKDQNKVLNHNSNN